MQMLLNYISILFLILSLFISGCKNFSTEEKAIIVSAEESYALGEKFLSEKKFRKAAKEFSKVYFQHPGNPITPYAEFMEAYAMYKAKEYLSAVDILKEFIALHPSNPYIIDAYYLQILSYANEGNDVYRDQENNLNAILLAEAFLRNFPNNKYTNNVKLQLKLLQDYITGHELVVGNYYINQNDPIASILRYQSAKRRYPNSVYNAESLYRLTISCKALGLKEDEKF